MSDDLTKADKKKVRQLAGIAWERELRNEKRGIADAISEIKHGSLSPFDVNARIHKFHNGALRFLYKQYSELLPWLGPSRAFFDRALTDDDVVDASDEVRTGIAEFADSFARLEAELDSAFDDDR